MTTFAEAFGPKFVIAAEKYWPYAFLICALYVVLFYIGIWNIVYKTLKQIMCIAIMIISVIIWWVLINKHWSVIQENGVSSLFSAFSSLLQGETSTFLSNTKLMDPLSEIILITGATLFILGCVYRHLPVDLIPDCIPCIGKYDNMFAGFVAIIGALICSLGIYLQIYYSDAPNSTTTLLNKSNDYYSKTNDFLHNNNSNKWDNVQNQMHTFLDQSKQIIKTSFSFIYQQIKTKVDESQSSLKQEF